MWSVYHLQLLYVVCILFATPVCGLYTICKSLSSGSCPRRHSLASAQVFKTGVDEWLRLCQYFALLAYQYCPDVQSPQKKSKGKCPKKGGKKDKAEQNLPAVKQILGLQLGDSAERGKSGTADVLLFRQMTWLTPKPDVARRGMNGVGICCFQGNMLQGVYICSDVQPKAALLST